MVVFIGTFEKDMSKANGDACKSLVTTSSTTSADESPKMVSSCKINGCSPDNDQLLTNGNAAKDASSKLSKIGRRIRDSCRQHLRGKHLSGGTSSAPEDYGSIPASNESCRSSHYVPMDFSGGKSGRIVTAKDMPGQQTTKDGYTYFRRKIEAQNVEHLLTETQANIHKDQPWYHKSVSRDLSQKILASHSVDGLFLVRESSVQGGFVISYYFNGRAYHAPVMPFTHPSTSAVTYSLDEGKTKFYDLLQLVEFYQLNKGTLCGKLTHFVINKISVTHRSESPTDSTSSCKHASDVSLDSSKEASTDDNHNSKANSAGKAMETRSLTAGSNSGSEDERSVTTAVDANMASEEEAEAEIDESMKDC